jgi:hypothetical protein
MVSADVIVWCHAVGVVSVVYMQKWIHLVQKLCRNEYFQSHFLLRVSFFAAGSTL